MCITIALPAKRIQETKDTPHRKPKDTRIKSPPSLSSSTPHHHRHFSFFKFLDPSIELLVSAMMNPSPKSSFVFSASSAVTFALHKNNSTPPPQQIPVSHTDESAAAAASTIQSAYRSHRIRSLYRRISAVDAEADRVQALIQRQETVDAVRRDDREKLRMNEALMRLLLELDSVPGFDPSVREARRKASRRIVGLQEILDGIAEASVLDQDYYGGDGRWGPRGLFYWDEAVEEMEERVCRERGGEEMDRFCAEYLGFRCFQRFLRE